MSEKVQFTFEGTTLEGHCGESLAAALVSSGILEFRETRQGAARGIFCGMGVCQDCLVEVDGKPNQRACMTKLQAPVTVRREAYCRPVSSVAAGEPPRLIEAVPEERPEVLVIGAGPGGLAAAIAAQRAGATVTVVDERPSPGGQYFKQVMTYGEDVARPDQQHLEGARLIATARKAGVNIRCGVDIWGAFGAHELIGTESGFVRRFNPQRLIVATGAYERGLPLPGWTLPGVMTTGAAQTLWRSYRRLAGKRILIAGNGPLNLQVASELSAGGAEIVAIVEIAPVWRLRVLPNFLRMLAAAPGLVVDGLKYRGSLACVRLIYGSVLSRVEQTQRGLIAHVSRHPVDVVGEHRFTVDTVCLGYGFEPSNEILRALGCRHVFDPARGQFTTVIDEQGRTSVRDVFSLGDCTGLGGARVALAQGAIVGAAAAAELGHSDPATASELKSARRALGRHRRFQTALWGLYGAPRLNLEVATPDTIVCRCEEITLAQIEAALADGRASIGDLKRMTRAGMGPCQGRYCGAVLSQLLAKQRGRELDEDLRFAPRVPIKPVAIADIARSRNP
jgi:NADPH-dependent 2,4-dienoyl-CoA reductase/sulfur reductase-like enzyme